MAIAFDASPSAVTGSAVETKTWAHTCTGSNLILIVGLAFRSTVSSVSVTYNGVAMTSVGDTAAGPTGGVVYMFRLVNPATGANNVVANWTTASNMVGGSMSFTGVSQSDPIGTPTTATGTASPATTTVSSATGELVVDALSSNAVLPSVGADQTTRYGPTLSTNVYGAGSTEAGASSVTMSWTFGSAANWGIVAVPLKPSVDFVPRVAFIA